MQGGHKVNKYYFVIGLLHGLEICKALTARGKKKSTNLKKFNSQQ